VLGAGALAGVLALASFAGGHGHRPGPIAERGDDRGDRGPWGRDGDRRDWRGGGPEDGPAGEPR
jgi:hypothetical protein